MRWQGYAEMTVDLLDRLAREAVDETRNAAAAVGYFSAEVDVSIDRSADPVAVTLEVDAGAATRIASVRIVVTGPAATDVPLGTDAIAELTRDWSLAEGEIFRQSAWTIAKERALATLSGTVYAAARIERSEAADRSRSAGARTSWSSSPADRRSGSAVSTSRGSPKYDASLVRNYSTIAPASRTASRP